ncbi:MAG: hypothetical protein M1829_005518 [Trizodia sp. TS-e1964]|nr:MAG: hypothetical protein M1829_005518 [Trizodia sp. TS-e1964]
MAAPRGHTPRLSLYSNHSSLALPRAPAAQQSQQMSTTSLLNALHIIYTSAQPLPLDASTSLVVNTWLSATHGAMSGADGGTVDVQLAVKAWEHARRRAEDACVVLASLHPSTPSVLVPFLSSLPISVPNALFAALAALRPFLSCASAQNPSASRHAALGVTFTLSLSGTVYATSLALSNSGIDTSLGLLNVPPEQGNRAFDVFYYLLTSASTPAEREFLGLKDAAAYTLLAKSATYTPPAYLPAADDAAAAEDFRASLKAIGIQGRDQRSLLSVLAGLLKLGETLGFLVDEEVLEEICEDVSGLLGLEPDVLLRKCSTMEREILIGGIYEALVDWVIARANLNIAADLQRMRDVDSSSDGAGARTPVSDEGDSVSITVIDIPGQAFGKALALRGVFDDTIGINAEMKEDGVDVEPAGASILKEIKTAVSEVEADLGISGGLSGREREHERDRLEGVLEKVGREAEADGFLRQILYPVENEGVNNGRIGRMDVAATILSSRVWYHLSLHPTDESPASLASHASTTSAWSAGTVSRQLRAWRLPEWANRRNRNLDYTADFDIDEFCTRYAPLGCHEGRDGVESWILERGWSNGEAVLGRERVWIREAAWWEAESMLDLKPANMSLAHLMDGALDSGYSNVMPASSGSGYFAHANANDLEVSSSRDQLLQPQRQSTATLGQLGARSIAPTMTRPITGGDYGLGHKGDDKRNQVNYYGEELGHMDPELADARVVTEKPSSRSRTFWVGFVWALTFWIPSFLLRYIGGMKRPDIRMAWREKLVLFFFIGLLNAIVVFWIVEFGRLLCPNFDKAWDEKEVSYHQGDNDYWVSIHGKVYDLSSFWKLQHSDNNIETTPSLMQPFAGLNLDGYFMPPLTISCPGLVKDQSIALVPNNTVANPAGLHTSGPRFQADPTTALNSIDWYTHKFLPRIQQYYKGDLVTSQSRIQSEGQDLGHKWVIMNDRVYDLTDYFNTLKIQNNLPSYAFLDSKATQLIKDNPGQDISADWKKTLNASTATTNLNCLENTFYVGKTDFRESARCQVNNWILLAFTILLVSVILVKFLAALQLGSKRRPTPQDKFVICQVPAYTEGEDQLRKGLDSLTALEYDNKRKLICVICDGMITGGGNDRPTPKIVLDILGVDPKIDPPALPFLSVGEGSDQLNYGKVYSGLYEFEGNVVPYIVVVKVGRESEQAKSKPGNRGKRDSQVLLLRFLNRVHHRSPMSPLELEMFHQINNIIGVDPELYEYLLMVDADTSVKEDSLNRLVASCANDAKIAGICGETNLENQERSWWTMIQVYEYYISHHLAKAFESLFGSVTCLPGCFCMYRLRTADKGKPLIISDKIIQEYSDGEVDTLHKKNLLSLGEDRYLTTLMTKHFFFMSYKFIPDAYASTAAPESWSVLLSQRRRWINSTIHNLSELVFLKELCGFCCFSMRFVVFIDLFGTLILPATCGYLAYLIYRVATRSGQFPLISLIMIAAVYGLQAIIFIVKRKWEHIGWMIIYILAFPIYSFVLPVYSFWNQDNFSWGNTRIVIGEKGTKQVISVDEEDFNPASIPLQRWDDYAVERNLPGNRNAMSLEKARFGPFEDSPMDGDDQHSMYSSVRPASTIHTAFHGHGTHLPPPMQNRQSSYSTFTDLPQLNPSFVQMSNLSPAGPYQDNPPAMRNSMLGLQSSDNLMTMQPNPARLSRSPLGNPGSRPVSQFDFQHGMQGPDDAMVIEAVKICLQEVDLDTVTKKHVRTLVEQRLQTELSPDRKKFLDRQIDQELANM